MSSCGVHPWARFNFYPSSEHCIKLLENILSAGFCLRMVNKAGVAVEEVPVTSRPEGYITCKDYNLRESAKDSRLSGLFKEEEVVQFGLVAHNHMLLICRALLAGHKEWRIKTNRDLRIELHHNDGRLNWNALADDERTKGLWRFLSIGCTFRVLSYKINLEEPCAVALISQSRNNASNAVLENKEILERKHMANT